MGENILIRLFSSISHLIRDYNGLLKTEKDKDGIIIMLWPDGSVFASAHLCERSVKVYVDFRIGLKNRGTLASREIAGSMGRDGYFTFSRNRAIYIQKIEQLLREAYENRIEPEV